MGTLTLTGANTYSGATYLDQGTLTLQNSDAIGTLGTLHLAGGTLTNTGTYVTAVTLSNPIVVDAASELEVASTVEHGGLTLDGPISGAGTIDCIHVPLLAGELDLGGDNSGFSGVFHVDGSFTEVYFTQPSAGSANATWQVDNWALLAANLSSNQGNEPIQLGALVSADGYGTVSNVGIPVTFQVGGNVNNPSTEFDGVIADGSSSSTVALTKVGAGRLTLGGANTYSGVTTIESGTLDVTNATAMNTVLSSTLSAGVNDTGGFLIFDYSGGTDPEATVLTLLTAAYNSSQGHFQSGQIYDTAATTVIGLGWVDNTTTLQVIVMPARYGDATLDGVVGPADLSKLLSNYGITGATWAQGDFNYDGTVGPADMSKLLSNYGQTGPLNINNAP